MTELAAARRALRHQAQHDFPMHKRWCQVIVEAARKGALEEMGIDRPEDFTTPALRLGHSRVDVLRVSGDGEESAFLEAALDAVGCIPAAQLVIGWAGDGAEDPRYGAGASPHYGAISAVLRRCGMRQAWAGTAPPAPAAAPLSDTHLQAAIPLEFRWKTSLQARTCSEVQRNSSGIAVCGCLLSARVAALEARFAGAA
eukprot:gene8255-31_t